MALLLTQLEADLAAAPLTSPYSWPLTLAIVSDVYRLAGKAPPPPTLFASDGKPGPSRADPLGVLAHLLAVTVLRDESVLGLRASRHDATAALRAFLEATEPLTAEMIRANVFRREELVRRWLEATGGELAGETRSESAARLEQLDYRKTLAEFARAEDARKQESERRGKLLREAQEREAAARGWRE